MPSSVRVGSRCPRSCLILSYSSGVRPCCRRISSEKAEVMVVVIERLYCRIWGRSRHPHLLRIQFFNGGPVSGNIQPDEIDDRGNGRGGRTRHKPGRQGLERGGGCGGR